MNNSEAEELIMQRKASGSEFQLDSSGAAGQKTVLAVIKKQRV